MSTLAVRLSGPLQSWGELSKFNTRATLGYPTYSGLLGLTRAALGITRTGRSAASGEPFDDAWLRTLSMVVRVDQRGRELLDYHTVNPPPVNRYRNIGSADRRRLATIAVGSGAEWKIKGRPQTLVTYRYYLQDAAFTWLISGHDDHIARVHDGLTQPHWQLSLGRKSCVPDYPLVLGRSPWDLQQSATRIPALTRDTGQLALHWLTEAPPNSRQVVHVDDPIGHHPQDGYRSRTRSITRLQTPKAPDRRALLTWCSENLS